MALQRSLPILAICRGARRSTSPAAARCTSTSRATARPSWRREPTHEVEIDGALAPAPHGSNPHARRELLPPPGGRPASATACGSSARAPDGTIEAIEGDGFVVGVQWHAETLVAHMPLFEALVTAASRTELRAAA